jgi:membrane-associated phospholipid phosphatase
MKDLLYDWGGLNLWVFHAINGIHRDWLDQAMLLGTRLGDHGNFPLYLGLAALFAVYAARDRAAVSDGDQGYGLARLWLGVLAVFAAAYVLDGWLIGWLKPWLDFPRPLLALPAGSVIVVGVPELHHSLPSGHASFAMVLAASLWPAFARTGRLFLAAFVLWVGLSRISLGAHFPADVAAGYLMSLVLVLGVRMAVDRLQGTPIGLNRPPRRAAPSPEVGA